MLRKVYDTKSTFSDGVQIRQLTVRNCLYACLLQLHTKTPC